MISMIRFIISNISITWWFCLFIQRHLFSCNLHCFLTLPTVLMGATVRVAIIRHLKNGIYVFCTLAKFCEPNLSVEQALTWYGSIASRTLGSMGVVDCASRYKGFISGSGTEERRAAEVLGATRGTRRQRSRAGNIFSAMCCFKSMLAILTLVLNFTF